MIRILILSVVILSGCDGGSAPMNTIPPQYNPDGRPNTSYERQQAVTDQMVRQGVSRADAEATTQAIYDAEREFQRNNR
jgi:membrane carboxypeptidase/penicillin-binding protein